MKVLDTNKREFYFYENTSRLTWNDIVKIHNATVKDYQKQVKKAEELKAKNVFIPSRRQYLALQYLLDYKTRWVGLGGGRGGAKTSTGVYWIITQALTYAGTQWAIGRRTLTALKRTTLPSMFEMLNDILKVPKSYYKYKEMDKKFEFKNGSVVYLIEMDWQPSDPEYTRLAGFQITGGMVDEANEVTEKAIAQLMSSVGRAKNKEYKIKGKLLCTFNPDKGFVYDKFFKPWKDGVHLGDTVYIPSLALNNPHITLDYLKTLWDLPPVQKQRLLLGNFDFDDQEGALVAYPQIQRVWTNVSRDVEGMYLTVDVGGSSAVADETVFVVWRGWEIIGIKVSRSMMPQQIIDKILELKNQYKIPLENIAIDAIGIGEGIAHSSALLGVYPFKSSNAPIPVHEEPTPAPNKVMVHKPTSNFLNLRAQCGWRLAEKITQGNLAIRIDPKTQVKVDGRDMTLKDVIESELSLLRDANVGKDNKKLQIISKKDMKERLGGRSPNFLDAIMMRAVFEFIGAYDTESISKRIPLKERRFFNNRKGKFIYK